MTNLELMKTENVRIVVGDKWLYYDKIALEWVVRQQKRHAHKSVIIFAGSEEQAVDALLGEK